MKVIYSKDAEKDLCALDPSVAKKVIKKVKDFTDQDNPLLFAKPLTANLSGLYRFRVGDYRVIFSIEKDGSVTVLTVLRIAHRKDVYR